MTNGQVGSRPATNGSMGYHRPQMNHHQQPQQQYNVQQPQQQQQRYSAPYMTRVGQGEPAVNGVNNRGGYMNVVNGSHHQQQQNGYMPMHQAQQQQQQQMHTSVAPAYPQAQVYRPQMQQQQQQQPQYGAVQQAPQQPSPPRYTTTYTRGGHTGGAAGGGAVGNGTGRGYSRSYMNGTHHQHQQSTVQHNTSAPSSNGPTRYIPPHLRAPTNAAGQVVLFFSANFSFLFILSLLSSFSF